MSSTTSNTNRRSPSSVASWSAALNKPQSSKVVSIGADDSNSGTLCDRRLSRAARSLVQEVLVDFLKQEGTLVERHGKKKSDRRKDVTLYLDSESSVWRLLSHILPSSSSSLCPLRPDLDILKDNEEHVELWDAQRMRSKWTDEYPNRAVVATVTPTRGYSRNPFYYHCAYCHKTFATRYYLDLHMQQAHGPSQKMQSLENETAFEDPPMVCPGVEWCQFLSIQKCHEHALEIEPFYGPGSEGRREDRHRVALQLWKEAHLDDESTPPCTTQALQEAYKACRTTIETCFPENDDDDQHRRAREFFQKRLCPPLSCPNHLHRLYLSTQQRGHLILREIHDWQDEWVYWTTEYHEVTWVGYLIVVLLILYYASFGAAYVRQSLKALIPRTKGPTKARLLKRKQNPKPNHLGSKLRKEKLQ